MIGFSQGGLLSRGYIEMCNQPRVHTFVSWVSPQAGVYGVPTTTAKCLELLHNSSLCNLLLDGFGLVVYSDILQKSFSFSGYWKDPFQLDKYVLRNMYEL